MQLRGRGTAEVMEKIEEMVPRPGVEPGTHGFSVLKQGLETKEEIGGTPPFTSSVPPWEGEKPITDFQSEEPLPTRCDRCGTLADLDTETLTMRRGRVIRCPRCAAGFLTPTGMWVVVALGFLGLLLFGGPEPAKVPPPKQPAACVCPDGGGQ